MTQQNVTTVSVPTPKFLRMNDDLAIPGKTRPEATAVALGHLDRIDDLDLSAPPPGYHPQGCACGLGCVSQVE